MRAKLDEARRWRAIAVLGALDAIRPFHELLGWRELDAGVFREAARATLKEAPSTLALMARSLLLDRLHGVPSTAQLLVAWERDVFIDLPFDDPQADAWLRFFRRGWEKALGPSAEEDLDDIYVETAVYRAFGSVAHDLRHSPARTLAREVMRRPLSREDAFIFAREGMDHDDPCCDDPFVRVVRQIEHETLRHAATHLVHEVDEDTIEGLREIAEEWLGHQAAVPPETLMPFAHLALPRRMRPATQKEKHHGHG